MKKRTRIGVVLCLTISFFLSEIIVGLRNKSLALTADAYHNFFDIIAYAISLIATQLHEKGRQSERFTYAFLRAEIVGALFNGVFSAVLGFSMLVRSLERFRSVEMVESPFQNLLVGVLGLSLNLICAAVFHEHGGHQHGATKQTADRKTDDQLQDEIHDVHGETAKPTNIRRRGLNSLGVLIHLFSDALNNIAVICASAMIWKFSSPIRFYADPVVSVFISIIIFASATPLVWKSCLMLLEATPSFLDLNVVKNDVLAVHNVLAVHDLHVWHLSESILLASLRVHVNSMEDWVETERLMRVRFADAYDLKHVTISPEVFTITTEGSIEATGFNQICPSSEVVFGCMPT